MTLAAATSLHDASERISRLYRSMPFDHRRFLAGLESHPDYPAHMSDRYRDEYACFKYTVALALKPRSIVEVGVRGGVSALSFLSACPDALYTGFDNNRDAREQGIDFTSHVRGWFTRLDVRADLRIEDSQLLDRFPYADLVHIDGDHSFEGVRHDVVAAWRSGAPWILCDDADDCAVVAGIFYALKFDLDRGSAEWCYFPQTWTGNILIRTNAGEGQ